HRRSCRGCGSGDRLERVPRRSNVCREVLRLLLTDPALEPALEEGEASLGGQARGWLGDAARVQCVGGGRRERCELDELPRSKLRMPNDERVPRAEVAEVTEGRQPGSGGLKGFCNDVERRGLFGR